MGPIGASRRRSARPPTTVVWGVRNLLGVLGRRGVSPGAVRRAAGVSEDDLENPDGRIAAAAAYRAWQAAVALTADPDLGLVVAAEQPTGAFDILEYALRASPTLRRGFEQLVRYGRVAREDLLSSIQEEGSRVRVGFRLSPESPVLRQQADYFLLGWLRIARESCGRSDLAPLESCFPYPAPAGSRRLEQAFRGPLTFDAPAALVFDRESMSLPLVRPDPHLVQLLGRRLLRLLPPEAGSAASFALAVRRRVALALASGNVTALRIADELGVSARTLDRRLADEDTSFRELLDDVRLEMARKYLRDPRLSLGEIAFLLGYSEASAFHRSFRRWTGSTPLEFRRSP
jgi:AraC-like DNA-binding protein